MSLSLDAVDPEALRLAFLDNARNRLRAYFPSQGRFRRELYPKHLEFFEAGRTRRARAFVAGNQVGKSTTGAYETALHLTGRYPAWWTGKRFYHPIKAWAAGLTGPKVRDSVQAELMGQLARELGEPADKVIGVGTGMVPADSIVDYRMRQGTPDAIDTVRIRHESGGISTLTFKSYESGVDIFSAEKLHVIWLDEECPKEIWVECLLRTITTGGIVYLTATPMHGMTELMVEAMDLYREQIPLRTPRPLAEQFSTEDEYKNAEATWTKHQTATYVVMATWDDAPHLTEQAKADLLAKIPPYQRDARTKGIPQMGSGAVYPISETEIAIKPFPIPKHWPRCYALDVGWNRTAAIWLARNPDTGQVVAYHEYYRAGEEGMSPSAHVVAIQAPGKWIPGVIDPAARGRSQVDGRQLIQMYRDLGLHIVEAENAVETGVWDVFEAFTQGQLKVFETLKNFFAEFRLYRRDDKGKIVKQKDHLQDALRYGWESGRKIMKAEPPKAKASEYSAESYGSTGGWMK